MTPAGTSNELDVQNEWEENTHAHTHALNKPSDISFVPYPTPRPKEDTSTVSIIEQFHYFSAGL